MLGGLGQQLVGDLQRGLEIAVQARLVQARERERLQVAPPPLRRQGVLGREGVLEVHGAGPRVADLEGRAGQRRRELGVVALTLRRKHVDERADRAALAADEQVEPVLGHEFDREVPVGGGDRVVKGLGPHTVRRVPACGPAMQAWQLVPQLARGAGPQQLGEQQVVAEPFAA